MYVCGCCDARVPTFFEANRSGFVSGEASGPPAHQHVALSDGKLLFVECDCFLAGTTVFKGTVKLVNVTINGATVIGLCVLRAVLA